MDIGQRIRQRREALEMTQDELAKKVGYKSRSSINKIEADGRGLPQTKITKFAEALGTSPMWLMGWDGIGENGTNFGGVSNLMPLPYSTDKKIPLIGTIACGTPILATENIEKEIALPDNISADLCLQCKGDSMINAHIYDGSIVFIKCQPTVENGQIGAVLIDQAADIAEATLKRVYIYDDRIMLCAENPKYSPLIYVGEEMNNVRIIGKAVAFISMIR